jgi:hypothetical protein
MPQPVLSANLAMRTSISLTPPEGNCADNLS